MTVAPTGPVRIQTPRLVLRAFAVTDVPDLLTACADAEIVRWNPGPADADAGAATAFMSGRNDWSRGQHASWAMADLADRLIGSVSLHRIDPDQRDAEVGYWIGPWARRRGHATEAVSLASRFAFASLGLHRVYLYHAVENSGSCRVAAAAGFTHEGTLRQSFRYADGVHHDEHLHARLSTDSGGR